MVTIRYLSSGSIEPGYKGNALLLGPPAISIGPVAPGEGRTVPPPEGLVDLGQLEAISPTRTIRIWVNAQNAGVQENLYFRRSQGGWEYRLKALRIIPPEKHKKEDFFVDGQWIRTLKQIEWTKADK